MPGKKWYETKNWFEGAITKEEIKALERKLLKKYHPDKNKDADAEQIYKTILNQFQALPLNQSKNKQETYEERETRNAQRQSESREEHIKQNTYSSIKNLFVRPLGMNNVYASKYNQQEVRDFFIKNYATIEIDKDGNFTKNSKPIAEFFSKMATSDEFTLDKYNDFNSEYSGKVGDPRRDVKLNMEYLNLVTRNLNSDIIVDDLVDSSVVASYNYKTNRSIEVLQGFQKLGINFKLNTVDENGKTISSVPVDFANEKDNQTLDSIKLAGLKQMSHSDTSIDRQKAYYNILSQTTVPFDYNNAPHTYFEPTDISEIDPVSRLDRARDMADYIVSSKESTWDNDEVHNRDKMNDLAKLYNAYRELNNNKPSVELGTKILNKMDSLRIHNFRLSARDFEESYISQQKIMDAIRKDIGKEPLNKWQDVEKKLGRKVNPEVGIGEKLDIRKPNEMTQDFNKQNKNEPEKETALVVRKQIKISAEDLGEIAYGQESHKLIKEQQISKSSVKVNTN